ncbi:hypothetical protein OJ997_19980 [Solirubrobacter phytolaccae]|uniref:YtkA-like domain-containing protein n=1 Tax=Solirubrobacter phytolaccae TaxID=1404360 RepID=A0A9X3SCJ2_9ACTN|nr:hypothetical protein [Solirubrobacter phytolaccae]MDA0182600.1 hypothetical protein [Solirubrobacter phytolaccae]
MGWRSQRLAAVLVAGAMVVVAGCGGSGEGGAPAGELPAPPPAKTFAIADLEPAGAIGEGDKTEVSFNVRQPSGKPLTGYATGDGPHTGVHVMYVRSDLSEIIHRHPPIAPDGTIDDKVTFKDTGRYRMVVDAYPKPSGALKNFQLFRWLDVGEKAQDEPLPAFKAEQKVDGFTVRMESAPDLEALNASLIDVTVTDPKGRPAEFTPYYGALAHAIFFREQSLDYFHTHVCAPGTPGCTSTLGGAQVTGQTGAPGRLSVGVLLPVAGTWRLFIQVRANGKLLTAPFTLTVK